MLKVVGLAEQCIRSAGEPNEILQAKLGKKKNIRLRKRKIVY